MADRSLRIVPPSDPLLERHLTAWLGAWPPPDGRVVAVASPRRDEPGWDGRIRPLVGVLTPTGGVLSVPPAHRAAVSAALDGCGVDGVREVDGPLAAALGRSGAPILHGVFRWSSAPAPFPDLGVWIPVDDPSVPAWLHPFGGEVLVALDAGRYVAGVGIKRHDRTGGELAVVTEPAAQGRGLARRLVSQAARRVLAGGAVATYLHAPSNLASARVAEAAGFPDRGWQVLSLGPP